MIGFIFPTCSNLKIFLNLIKWYLILICISFTMSAIKHLFSWLNPIYFYAHWLLLSFTHTSFRYLFMSFLLISNINSLLYILQIFFQVYDLSPILVRNFFLRFFFNYVIISSIISLINFDFERTQCWYKYLVLKTEKWEENWKRVRSLKEWEVIFGRVIECWEMWACMNY